MLPGTGRFVRLGADGTPPVAEFAAAEFAAVNQMHPAAGANLMADALDLRHRHPASWAGIGAGRVRVWQARKVAHLTAAAGLRLEQARWVDAAVVGYYETLSWTRFLELVEARIIEVDPAAADARRRAAALERFVRTGQCNEYGLKTLVAKAQAGDVIFFTAMCDRIAQILRLTGDSDPVEVRRAKAIGILANPARALALLEDFAAGILPDGENPAASGTDGPVSGGEDADDNADSGADSGDDADDADEAEPEDPEPERIGEGDLHPSQNDADDPEPETHPCPACDGEGHITGDPSAFTRPVVRVDPARLLPAATLYLHMSSDSFTRDGAGVARFEGVGPITPAQAIEILGDHCRVRITPVIDVADQAPVDGYETPTRMREALHLRNPVCVFPWATNRSRTRDAEHTIPYLSPDDGGPPGQTNMANLAMIGRFPHRLKTHGRWRLKQPTPGVFLWRSPHGWYFHVDHTGTHPIPKTVGDAAWTQYNTTGGGSTRPGRNASSTGTGSRTRTGATIDIHPATRPVIEYEPGRHTDVA